MGMWGRVTVLNSCWALKVPVSLALPVSRDASGPWALKPFLPP